MKYLACIFVYMSLSFFVYGQDTLLIKLPDTANYEYLKLSNKNGIPALETLRKYILPQAAGGFIRERRTVFPENKSTERFYRSFLIKLFPDHLCYEAARWADEQMEAYKQVFGSDQGFMEKAKNMWSLMNEPDESDSWPFCPIL